MPEERRPGPSFGHVHAVIAVAALFASSLALFIWSECRVQTVVTSFSSASSNATVLPPPAFNRLIPRMEKQKEQYSSWAYTALAAVVAISVVKRVLPSPWIRWAYIALGPAAVLLLQTIRAGVYFDQRLTYLSVRGTINQHQFGGIQTLLSLQVSYLSAGLVVLLLFVASFLVAIVAGRLNLNQDTAEND